MTRYWLKQQSLRSADLRARKLGPHGTTKRLRSSNINSSDRRKHIYCQTTEPNISTSHLLSPHVYSSSDQPLTHPKPAFLSMVKFTISMSFALKAKKLRFQDHTWGKSRGRWWIHVVVPRNLLHGNHGYHGALKAMLTVIITLMVPVTAMADIVRRRRLQGMNV